MSSERGDEAATASGPASAPPEPRRPRLSRRRKTAFLAVSLLLALAVLEVGARLLERLRAGPVETNPYADFVNPVPLFERRTAAGQDSYQRTRDQPLVPGNQSFAATKPPGGLRVFVLGGSAAAGWPYDEERDGYTLSALLARELRLVLPGRPIEVLNVAGGSYGSHRVKFVFDEIIDYQPDLVVVMSGNNEFLESFVFRPRLLPAPLTHSALLRVTFGAVERLARRPRPKVDVANYSHADQASTLLSYAFGRASRYRQDPEQYRQLLDRYRFNISSMVAEAKRRGVALFLVNLPVNLKDWIPNVSIHRRDLTPAELDRWQERFRDGFLALEAGDPERAEAALAEAAAIDDEHAETHYRLGVALERLGRTEAAKAEYTRALERDAFPFRALPEFEQVLGEIARRQAVPLIDAIGIIDRRAEDGIPGLDVLIDYCHLTGSSQEAIAHAILEEMTEQRLLPAPPAVALEEARIDVPAVLDQLATDRGLVSLYRQVLMMRQYDKLDAIYDRLVRVLREQIATRPDRAQTAYQQLKTAEYAQGVIGPYRRLLRAEKLGLVGAEFREDEARAIFDDYIKMIRLIEGERLSWQEFQALVPDFEYRPAPAGTPGR